MTDAASPSLAVPSVAERFALVIGMLCDAIVFRTRENSMAAAGYQTRLPDSLLALFWRRARAIGARFAVLAAQCEAGPRKARVVRAAPAVAAPAGAAARPLVRRVVVRAVALPDGGFDRLPHWMVRTRGWMARLVPAGTCVGYLLPLLQEPQMRAMAASSPEMARLLRSLCWMLAVDPSAYLPPLARRQRRVPPPCPEVVAPPAEVTPSPEEIAQAEWRRVLASAYGPDAPPSSLARFSPAHSAAPSPEPSLAPSAEPRPRRGGERDAAEGMAALPGRLRLGW